jgi:Tfp pilus assembly protein PilV
MNLPEVVIAAFLLSMTLLSILEIMPGAILGEKRTQQRIVADSLGQAVLETARSTGFAQLQTTTLPDQPVDGTVYHLSETVTSLGTYLKQVDVTVSYTEPGAWTNSRTRTYNWRTLVCNVNQ